MSSLGAGDSVLLGVLRKQRSRLIASVMGAVEQEFPDASPESLSAVRRVVMSSATAFSELSIDALKSARDQSDYTNDEVLMTLRSVRSHG